MRPTHSKNNKSAMTRLPDPSQSIVNASDEERVSRLLTGLSAMAILFLTPSANSAARWALINCSLRGTMRGTINARLSNDINSQNVL